MELKLLLDEDVQVDLAEALQRKGVDAMTVEQLGIIVSKQLSVGEALRGLLNLAANLSAKEMRNRLEFLSDWCNGDSNRGRGGF